MKLKVLAYLVGALLIPLAACDDDPATTTTTDACEDLSLTCDANATCNETADPAVCECNTGFTGDGETCTAETTTVTYNWSQVSAGGRHRFDAKSENGHTCGISDGALYCWGDNSEGQLGTGDYVSSLTPVQVGTDTDWTAVSAGGAYTCGLKGSGSLWCWGWNGDQYKFDTASWSLLGLGASFATVGNANAPTQVGTDTDWTSITTANNHACGIRDDSTDQTVWCWGRNRNGQVGDATSTDSNVPVQEATTSTDWVAVEAGRSTTCGIRDDTTDRTLWCWGSDNTTDIDRDGGGDDFPYGSTPAQVITTTGNSNITWDKLAVSKRGICGIMEDGTLWCANDNNRHGDAGQGNFTSSAYDVITQVGTDTTWTDIDGGTGYFCGINNGSLYCWGRNHHGELGLTDDPSGFASCVTGDHGSDVDYDCTSPELTNGTNTWTSVSSGNGQTCAVTGTDLYCWGFNADGQVGDGSSERVVWDPTEVM